MWVIYRKHICTQAFHALIAVSPTLPIFLRFRFPQWRCKAVSQLFFLLFFPIKKLIFFTFLFLFVCFDVDIDRQLASVKHAKAALSECGVLCEWSICRACRDSTNNTRLIIFLALWAKNDRDIIASRKPKYLLKALHKDTRLSNHPWPYPKA